MYPDDLKYTSEHEWLRTSGETVRVGITHYAQEALGDIVYVNLPAVGAELQAGQPFGEVESTKSVSDIYAPVAGTVTARNETLDSQPELINADPYGDGWIVEISLGGGSLPDSLMSAEQYQSLVESH